MVYTQTGDCTNARKRKGGPRSGQTIRRGYRAVAPTAKRRKPHLDPRPQGGRVRQGTPAPPLGSQRDLAPIKSDGPSVESVEGARLERPTRRKRRDAHALSDAPGHDRERPTGLVRCLEFGLDIIETHRFEHHMADIGPVWQARIVAR